VKKKPSNFDLTYRMVMRVYLQVRLVFEEPEAGVTVVKLTHTDVPEEDRWVFAFLGLVYDSYVFFVLCCLV